MEGLKKNLHYVVFLVLLLAGLGLAGYGMMSVSSAEEALDNAFTGLPKGNVVTLKDVKDIETEQGRYTNEISDVFSALKGDRGTALRKGRTSYRSLREMYSKTASDALRVLEEGFKKLEEEQDYPEDFKGARILTRGGSSGENFWTRMKDVMNAESGNEEQVLECQDWLVIMQEVLAVCQQLKSLPSFTDSAVNDVEFKFERSRAEEGVSYPWTGVDFTVQLKCEPSFASALAAELVNPSARLNGSESARRLFPVELTSYSIALQPRPYSVEYRITNQMREGHQVPPDLEEGSGEQWVVAKDRIGAELAESNTLQQPVSAEISARALSIEANWKAFPKAEEGE